MIDISTTPLARLILRYSYRLSCTCVCVLSCKIAIGEWVYAPRTVERIDHDRCRRNQTLRNAFRGWRPTRHNANPIGVTVVENITAKPLIGLKLASIMHTHKYIECIGREKWINYLILAKMKFPLIHFETRWDYNYFDLWRHRANARAYTNSKKTQNAFQVLRCSRWVHLLQRLWSVKLYCKR